MRTLTLPLILLGALVVGVLGFVYWQQQTTYVSTDNAYITGTLVQVGTTASATIRQMLVEVGDEVATGQPVAIAAIPYTLSGGGQSSSQQLVSFVQLRANLDGVVVARHAQPGDSVASGRPVVTLVDPAALWVQAHIAETDVGRVRVGQDVEITVDSLGRAVPGRVSMVGGASTTTGTPTAQSGGSPFYVKTTQLVPVRIEFLSRDDPLVVGGSVYARIHVR